MSNGRKAIPPGPPWGKANGCSAMTSLVRPRVVLSFSRDLEFATETELAKRMGCQKHYWLRLRDSLVRVVNGQKRASRQHDEPSEWTTVELPASLPPPDAKLLAVLAKEIDSQDLPPMVVLESLNALYCRMQNQHELITPVGLPAPFEALEAELAQPVRTAEPAGCAS
jgi:hypothetical protein